MDLEDHDKKDEVEKEWVRNERGRLISRERGHEECENCSICLRSLTVGKTLCGAYLFGCTRKHKFHKDCIERFLIQGGGLKGCPLCREPLREKLREKYVQPVVIHHDDDNELNLIESIFGIPDDAEEFFAFMFIFRNSPQDFNPDL